MCLTSLPFIAPTPPSNITTDAQASAAYGQLPLSFEANQGQTDASVNFLSRGSGYTLFLTPSTAVIDLQQGAKHDAALSMQLVGGNAAARGVGLDEQASTSNYLMGSDPAQWHTGIANYGRVEYQNVYAGIDLAYYGNQRQLEYDFIVSPGADTKLIQLSFQGTDGLDLDSQGDLLVHTAAGDLVEHAPVLYQEINGIRQTVTGRYVLEEKGQVGFAVGAYDATQPLVIDPVFSMSYSTYLGGNSNETGYGIAVDAAGDAYVTGYTASTNFSTKNPLPAGNGGVFVAKLNPTGTALVYSTFLGSGGVGNGIAVDAAGNAYVTGYTSTTNFPTTPSTGAFQPVSGGGQDAFVTKLNSTGTGLVYSTYLGGSSQDQGRGIALDAAGNAYVTGVTSGNFPTTPGAFQTDLGNGAQSFVAELNAGGTALVYATYLGIDLPNAIAVDSLGSAYVTGSATSTTFPTTGGAFQTTPGGNSDAYVTKLLADGSGLAYSTLLGGSGTDIGYGIAVYTDALGSSFAYVTGSTESTNFPTTPGAFQTSFGGGRDAFVTRLNPTGTGLVYSTYLGGNNLERGYGIAVSNAGNAFVTGETSSTNFPTTPGTLQATLSVGADAFVAVFNAGGSGLVNSTYLGRTGQDTGYAIALDSSGNAYVTGETSSTDFLTTAGAVQRKMGSPAHTSDVFVTKIAVPSATIPALFVTSHPASATAGATASFTITAENIDGSTFAFYSGTVHINSSDPQAVLPANYTFTPTDQGVHTFSATFKTAGLQSLAAASLGMSGDPASILVNPAAAARFVANGPSSIRAGNAFSITVTVLDAYGNVATGFTGAVHLTSSDSTATLPANYTFDAAGSGVHSFTGLKIKAKGLQSITLADTATGSILGSLLINVR